MSRGVREPWTVDDAARLTDALSQLLAAEEELRRRKLTIVEQALRTTVGCCSTCHRPLISRRLWDLLPSSVRETGTLARRHNATTCFTHYIDRYRARRKVMDPARLAALRAAVGFNPTANYDEMEESA